MLIWSLHDCTHDCLNLTLGYLGHSRSIFGIAIDIWHTYVRIPENLSFLVFKFLFWSLWSHLSSTKSWLYSVSCYLLLYIIFLVCHLSISLPRGQDDYIIELHFNSIYIWLFGASGSHFLCPCHLGHLITWGIMSPSFWHLCHLLIIWAHLITFLILSSLDR